MSEERQETIEDIVDDIRAQNQGLPEDSYALSPLVCDLLSIADRIEATAKHQFREVTKMMPHEEVDVSKMETTTPTGNAAAMRDALLIVKRLFDGRLMWQSDIRKAHEAVNAALSAPPRNCDDCNTVDDAVALAIHLGVVDCDFGAREIAEFLLAEAEGYEK